MRKEPPSMSERTLRNLTRTVRHLLAGSLFAAPFAMAQQPAPAAVPTGVTFDVISVKPDKGGDTRVSMQFTADGFHANNVNVHMLLLEGFGLNEDQITGEPSWTKTDNFDIDAKVAAADVAAFGKLTFDQRRSMFQQVLPGRFKLTPHHDTKDLPVYDLVVANPKNGPKFQESKPPDPADSTAQRRGIMMSHGKITMMNSAMPFFTTVLSRQIGRTVIDKTGLTGNYDFTLEFTQEGGGGPGGPPQREASPGGAPAPGASPAGPPAPDSSAPDTFTASQEQR